MCAAQMRFPRQLVGKDGMLHAHNLTLLDGEMLVDEDIAAGTQTRRFLAYDLVALNGKSCAQKPWKVGAKIQARFHPL